MAPLLGELSAQPTEGMPVLVYCHYGKDTAAYRKRDGTEAVPYERTFPTLLP